MKSIYKAATEYAGINDDDKSTLSLAYNKIDIVKAFTACAEFVQRWIPVEEELPTGDEKKSIRCLVKTKYEGIVVRWYNTYHKCWDDEDGDDSYSDAVGGKVTHWRPINHK